MNQCFYLALAAPFLNDPPQLDQEFQIGTQGADFGALRHRTYDGAAFEPELLQQLLDQAAQSLTLVLIFDTRRDADAVSVG